MVFGTCGLVPFNLGNKICFNWEGNDSFVLSGRTLYGMHTCITDIRLYSFTKHILNIIEMNTAYMQYVSDINLDLGNIIRSYLDQRDCYTRTSHWLG